MLLVDLYTSNGDIVTRRVIHIFEKYEYWRMVDTTWNSTLGRCVERCKADHGQPVQLIFGRPLAYIVPPDGLAQRTSSKVCPGTSAEPYSRPSKRTKSGQSCENALSQGENALSQGKMS